MNVPVTIDWSIAMLWPDDIKGHMPATDIAIAIDRILDKDFMNDFQDVLQNKIDR